jgi:hypothetical protein
MNTICCATPKTGCAAGAAAGGARGCPTTSVETTEPAASTMLREACDNQSATNRRAHLNSTSCSSRIPLQLQTVFYPTAETTEAVQLLAAAPTVSQNKAASHKAHRNSSKRQQHLVLISHVQYEDQNGNFEKHEHGHASIAGRDENGCQHRPEQCKQHRQEHKSWTLVLKFETITRWIKTEDGKQCFRRCVVQLKGRFPVSGRGRTDKQTTQDPTSRRNEIEQRSARKIIGTMLTSFCSSLP